MSNEFRFSIAGIELLEKTFDLSNHKIDTQFSFNVRIEVSVDVAEKKTHHNIGIDVIQKENEQKIASLGLSCIFLVPDIGSYELKPNRIPLPNELLLLLNTVTIGTARGVLFSEFRGTFLHEALLPVIDPRDFQPT